MYKIHPFIRFMVLLVELFFYARRLFVLFFVAFLCSCISSPGFKQTEANVSK